MIDVHPKHFCFDCYRSMLSCQERKGARILYNCQIVYVTHDSDPLKCTTCQRYETVAKGGRPKSKVAKLAPGISGTYHGHTALS